MNAPGGLPFNITGNPFAPMFGQQGPQWSQGPNNTPFFGGLGNAAQQAGTGVHNALTGPGSPGDLASQAGNNANRAAAGATGQAPPNSNNVLNAQGQPSMQSPTAGPVAPNTNMFNPTARIGNYQDPQQAMQQWMMEQGINPFGGGLRSQAMLSAAPNMVFNALDQYMNNPSMGMNQAMANTFSQGMNGGNVIYGPNQANQVLANWTSRANNVAGNNMSADPMDMFANSLLNHQQNPQAEQLIASLLTGGVGGPMAKFLQSVLGQQGAVGQFALEHPDQYNTPAAPINYLQAFMNMQHGPQAPITQPGVYSNR